MGFMIVLDQFAMGAITEGSIGRVLAVAELIVAALGNIELDGPAAGDCGVAGAVTGGVGEGQSAGAPAVHFALLQVVVVGEPT